MPLVVGTTVYRLVGFGYHVSQYDPDLGPAWTEDPVWNDGDAEWVHVPPPGICPPTQFIANLSQLPPLPTV